MKWLIILVLLPFLGCQNSDDKKNDASETSKGIPDNYDSLDKYSYRIHGISKDNKHFTKGTAFFIRDKNRLFMLSAAHMFRGVKEVGDSFEVDKLCPDTIFVRIDRIASILWPINIVNEKRIKFHMYYDYPDLFIYEFKKPFKTLDSIYSIENLIDINIFKDRFYGECWVYGYGNGGLQMLELPILSKDSFQYKKAFKWGSINKIDSLNFTFNPASIIANKAVTGYSGAPIFFISNHRAFFLGECISGDENSGLSEAVKGEIVLKNLWQKIPK